MIFVGAGLVPAQNGASTRHCPYEMPQNFCLGTYEQLKGKSYAEWLLFYQTESQLFRNKMAAHRKLAQPLQAI